MSQTIKEIQADTKSINGLAPYHQLVELQKQMIQLAQQNERAKHECAGLRELVATEMISRTEARRSLRQRTSKILKQLPRTGAAKLNRVSLIIKQSSHVKSH